MDIPEVSIRFGLMLEAYLRGSINHMPDLRRQVSSLKILSFPSISPYFWFSFIKMDAIGKMRSISELLHSKAFKDRVGRVCELTSVWTHTDH